VIPRKSSKRTAAPLVDVSPGPSPYAASNQLSQAPTPHGSEGGAAEAAGAQPARRPSAAPSSPRLPFRSGHSSVRDHSRSTEDNSRTSSVLPPFEGDGSTPNAGASSLLPPPLSRAGSSGRARPTSMGFVPQHRARDNIHVVSPEEAESVDMHGSRAEIVQEHTTRSTSSDSRPRNEG
jgi:hypothetical protein